MIRLQAVSEDLSRPAGCTNVTWHKGWYGRGLTIYAQNGFVKGNIDSALQAARQAVFRFFRIAFGDWIFKK